MARHFELPENQVRVTVPDTGSGYGGKHTPEVDIEAARLARAVHAPVRVAWTREEEFNWAYFRPASVIDVVAGASRDGTLTSWQFQNDNAGTAGIESPYEVENQTSNTIPVTPPPGLVQGPGFHRKPFRSGERDRRAGQGAGLARSHSASRTSRTNGSGWCSRPPRPTSAGRMTRNHRSRMWAGDSPVARRRAACWRPARRCGSTERTRISASSAWWQASRPVPILNPDQLRNQVEGAIVMGLGGALFEAIQFSEGIVQNGRLSRYRVPPRRHPQDRSHSPRPERSRSGRCW